MVASGVAKIKQFSKCQYDMPNGSMACTAISLVAASEYLRKHGRTKSSLWSDEAACEIMTKGVALHNAWVQQNADGDTKVYIW